MRLEQHHAMLKRATTSVLLLLLLLGTVVSTMVGAIMEVVTRLPTVPTKVAPAVLLHAPDTNLISAHVTSVTNKSTTPKHRILTGTVGTTIKHAEGTGPFLSF
jgi:hypothetical protein